MKCLCQTREEVMHYEAVYEREEGLIAPFPAAKVNTTIAATGHNHHLPPPNTIHLPHQLPLATQQNADKITSEHKMEWMLPLHTQK